MSTNVRGCAAGAAARALGFALTFYPSVFLLIAMVGTFSVDLAT